jgi:hypothetical protein
MNFASSLQPHRDIVPTCFLVMGQPRSGTSAVAGILHHLGIPMGERIVDPREPDRWDFPEADEWNPRGYFQDAAFMNLEDAEFGRWAPPDNWIPSARFVDALGNSVELRQSRGGDWGLKSNRLQFYLTEFRRVCADTVKIIVTRREMERSLASWVARGGGSHGEAFIRMASAKLFSVSADLCLHYDHLFDRTEETVSRIAAFVGRDVTQAAMAHIVPNLRRH